MLTKQQKNLLLFINERLSDDGIAPSFDEMRDALGLKSKSGVHRMVAALVERGFLERLPNRARALAVKRLPGDSTPSDSSNDRISDQKRSIGGMRTPGFRVGLGSEMSSMMTLPLYGKIAAGTPISALADTNETIDIPAGMIGSGDHYALTVEGDSMKDAGIHDADIVLIKKSGIAHDGDIVVALVDDSEATLKRFSRDHDSIILYPANESYKPLRLESERVEVQGLLVGLVRRY